MDLKITDDQILSIVSSTILATLTPELKEKLISEALIKIITPDVYETPNHGGGKQKISSLQRMFLYALEESSRHIVHDLISKDEAIKARLETVARESFMKAISDETVINKISDFIVKALTSSPLDR